MNRHGISLNPTQEEATLLRRLWQADDAMARAGRAEGDIEYWRSRALEAERKLRHALAALDEEETQ